MEQVRRHVKADPLRYEYHGQFVAFPAVSQTVTEVELTVVKFTYWQLVTQDELDLWMKLGEEQVEQMYVAGEPMEVVWIP